MGCTGSTRSIVLTLPWFPLCCWWSATVSASPRCRTTSGHLRIYVIPQVSPKRRVSRWLKVGLRGGVPPISISMLEESRKGRVSWKLQWDYIKNWKSIAQDTWKKQQFWNNLGIILNLDARFHPGKSFRIKIKRPIQKWSYFRWILDWFRSTQAISIEWIKWTLIFPILKRW